MLAGFGGATRPSGTVLRSSPAPEGRCWVISANNRLDRYTRLRSSPAPEGRCWPSAPRPYRRRPRCCDPRRPRRAGAGGAPVAASIGPATALRSSPAPEGRCWRWSSRHRSGRSGLRSSPAPEGRCWCPRRRPWRSAGSCCDPRRPRRAGAGKIRRLRLRRLVRGCDPRRPRAGAGSGLLCRLPHRPQWLRSSPAPEGRCWWHDADRLGGRPVIGVAILAGPGGPVLAGPVAGLEDRQDRVAILAGPGGPVLAAGPASSMSARRRLRSSPAPEGRCWIVTVVTVPDVVTVLRSSPAPEGRCWDLEHDRVRVLSLVVAILAGPGGPVLADALAPWLLSVPQLRSSPAPEGRCWCGWKRSPGWSRAGCDPRRPRRAGAGQREPSRAGGIPDVAILAGPGGPVLVIAYQAHIRARPGCDPRRPRRAGAGFSPECRHGPAITGCDPRRPRRAGAGLYQSHWLKDPDPGLRSSPAPEGRCWRRAPGRLPPKSYPVAILAGPGGPVLAGQRNSGSTRYLLLRSSPAPEGRCWPHPGRPLHLVPPVAILAGPGGPVLAAGAVLFQQPATTVAILAGPGGPVLGGAHRMGCRLRRRCDPRRPRRAGAVVGVADQQGPANVAILAGPGGPVLSPVPPSLRALY